MTQIGADVTAGFQYAFDVNNEFVITKDTLNLLALPLVTVDLTNQIDTEDIKDTAVTEAKIAPGAITADKLTVVQSQTTTPIAADQDRIVALIAFADGALAIGAQPDIPRNITVTLTDADSSVTAGDVTIVGTGPGGVAVTEVFSVTSGAGTQTLTGLKIFGNLTSITIANVAGAGAGDDVEVGIGNVIGLPNDIVAASGVKHVYFNALRESAPTISFGAEKSGVDVAASGYDASKRLIVYYNIGE